MKDLFPLLFRGAGGGLAVSVLLVFAGMMGCSDDTTGPDDGPPAVQPPRWYTYTVVNTYPHDVYAFSEGLIFSDGYIYEGTGGDELSSLREVDLTTGAVRRSRFLPARPDTGTYFGEGIALVGNRIYQQTWHDSVGFVWDRETFDSLGWFRYDVESWGVTFDGARFIVADGSANLYFYDTASWVRTGSIQVHDTAGPVRRLNELEYINGEVWANIWFSDLVARIDPATGRVAGYVEMGGLLDSSYYYGANNSQKCLNGIAYDSVGNRVFMTGKWWPNLFEVRVVERP